MVEQSLIFRFKISNNQAEYEALVVDCWTDLQLVVEQMNGIFQINDYHVLQCYHKARNCYEQFREIWIRHISHKVNARADVLSKLMTRKEKGQLTSVIRQVLMKPIIDCLAIVVAPGQSDWRMEIISLIRSQESGGILSTKDAKRIARYLLIGEELYKRGLSSPLLKCVSPDEADYVLRELHDGVCGMHTGQRWL